MRIAIVNNLYPPYGRNSGAEIIAANMSADLKLAGHEVLIITSTLNNEQTDTDSTYFLNSSYRLLSQWTSLRKLIWHLGQLIIPWHKRKLKQILNTKKVDLVITHNLIGLGFYLPRLLRRLNIPHHHLLHDIQLLHPSGLMYFGQENIINSLLARCYQFFTKQSLSGAAQIISPSQWLLQLHQEKGFFNNQKTLVRPNFKLEKQTPKNLTKPVQFIFAGQLEKHKGIHILLEAWEKAAIPKEKAQLNIVGGGSLLNLVQAKSHEIDNINYAGYLSHEETEKLIKQLDVLILPSLVYENSPTSLWEAAKYGLHAIASDIGGISELKEYLDLKLIPPNNSEALAQMMINIVKNLED
ncbi:glycosyltransferase [Patescibacteria group bacterium]|nr:glycosyltransferase [Patescibacteria group bacterium]